MSKLEGKYYTNGVCSDPYHSYKLLFASVISCLVVTQPCKELLKLTLTESKQNRANLLRLVSYQVPPGDGIEFYKERERWPISPFPV